METLETIKYYNDASPIILPSGFSIGEHVISLLEKIIVSLIVWTFKFQCVFRRTSLAEDSAMTDALDLSYFISQVLSEIIDAKYQRLNKISACTVSAIVFTDNKLY